MMLFWELLLFHGGCNSSDCHIWSSQLPTVAIADEDKNLLRINLIRQVLGITLKQLIEVMLLRGIGRKILWGKKLNSLPIFVAKSNTLK